MDYTVVLAVITGFIVTALLAKTLIPALVRLKFGQSIREDGPSWHKGKQGTPTMGGLFFIVGIVLATVVFSWQDVLRGDYRALMALAVALFYGFIGFIDDFIKVVRKRNLGLTARQKLLLQILVALAFVASLKLMGYVDTLLYLPFFNINFDLGIWYYPLALIFIVGLVNAVNLTDGLDGLATCVTLPVALFFGMLAWFFGSHGMMVFCGAASGALLGFLLFNFFPAKVFMGDTGSLFLGGASCAMAMVFNMPLVLVIAGLVYLLEALSVILQVLYFKLTHGKRLFKMAPLHHHFEMSGMSEVAIVYLFSFVTLALCVAAYFGVTGLFAV